MNTNAEFKIDLSKVFPTLPNAPIVEASLGIQARAEGTWEAPVVSDKIKAILPDYAKLASQNQVAQEIRLEPSKLPQTTTQDLGWNGFRIQSEVKPHIAQFNRDGFLFSRLHPYETWENFTREALRLWRVYVDLAKPTQVQRISLRYINKIGLPPNNMQFEDYLQPAPALPQHMEVPFYGFFHQDMLAVPGHEYSVNIIRTVQQPQDPANQGIGLILDITVITMKPFALGPEALDKRLPEMRWLKNEVFYGSITEKALESFKC
jgi:uncharacterized protein (TIGR04255 family)